MGRCSFKVAYCASSSAHQSIIRDYRMHRRSYGVVRYIAVMWCQLMFAIDFFMIGAELSLEPWFRVDHVILGSTGDTRLFYWQPTNMVAVKLLVISLVVTAAVGAEYDHTSEYCLLSMLKLSWHLVVVSWACLLLEMSGEIRMILAVIIISVLLQRINKHIRANHRNPAVRYSLVWLTGKGRGRARGGQGAAKE